MSKHYNDVKKGKETIDKIREEIIRKQLSQGLVWNILVDNIPSGPVTEDDIRSFINYVEVNAPDKKSMIRILHYFEVNGKHDYSFEEAKVKLKM